MQLTEQQLNHFRTFGFLVFRQLFSPEELKRFSEEFDRGLDIGLEGGQHNRQARHYALLTYETTPFSCSLHDDPRFADVAEQLLGKPVLGVSVNGNYYVGDTQWHPDNSTFDYEGVKFAMYLEPLDAKSGALRLIPGSHRDPLYHDMAKDPLAKFGVRPEDAPAFVFNSQPGDVLVFNLACWHASFGGSDHRRMGVIVYYEDPQNPVAEDLIKNQLLRNRETALKYGQPGYFSDYWLSIKNPRHQRWVQRLEQMGLLATPAPVGAGG